MSGIFIPIKIHALFPFALWGYGIFCFATIGAVYFLCVASAAHFFIYRALISKYEFGDAMPNARMFQKICNTLKISMNDLFE